MAEDRMRDIRCNNKRPVPPFSLTPFTAQIPTSSPERAEKNTQTRKKVLETSQSPADKTRQIKTTWCAGVGDLAYLLLLHLFVFFFSSLLEQKWSQARFTLRLWLTEVYACFIASCSCAKHGIYIVALLFWQCAPTGNFVNGFYRRLSCLNCSCRE